MKRNIKLGHITPVGVDAYSDLRVEQNEIVQLHKNSSKVVSEKQSIKESLMTELAVWIVEKKLKQADAAQILGIARPRVSYLVNKKLIKFSIDSLVDMLIRTGRHIRLSVHALGAAR